MNVRKVVAAATVWALLQPGLAPIAAQKKKQNGPFIKHVVVIFGENVSFDHYFGTYPSALNPAGEPQF
jgi:phospholipase C